MNCQDPLDFAIYLWQIQPKSDTPMALGEHDYAAQIARH